MTSIWMIVILSTFACEMSAEQHVNNILKGSDGNHVSIANELRKELSIGWISEIKSIRKNDDIKYLTPMSRRNGGIAEGGNLI